jgi:hypothetical protein
MTHGCTGPGGSVLARHVVFRTNHQERPVSTIQTPTESTTSPASYEPRTTRRRTFTETRDGFKTSEFYVTLAFVAAVLIATYVDDDSLARDDGWLFAAMAVVGYVVSRGLAKVASREPIDEAR